MSQINWPNVDILIVEDSPTQALCLQKDLEQRNAKVRVAFNGVEGLDSIQKDLPAVIISDINMPKMNGYEFCREVKSKWRIPIILLTVLSDPLDVIKGVEAGADYFLTKPCQPDLLFSYIEDVLLDLERNEADQYQRHRLKFAFQGKPYELTSSFRQITGLLLSTYSTAMQKNRELEQSNRELNLIYQELREKNEHLSKLNEEKNNLLGMAAHDLRNPLGVILGYTNLLIEQLTDKLDAKSLTKLNHIKNSSSHMLSIINDLLDISAIESGKVKLNLAKEDIVSLVKNTVELNQELAENKNIQLIFSLPETNFSVVCDKDKIEQVITNLLTNAIKYSNPNTIVQVSVNTSNEESVPGVLIKVKDQGQGIPPSEESRLFQTFSKTSIKSTSGEKSTGLGLAIAKKIVDAHQGKIWVESKSGAGSSFYVFLPFDKAKQEPITTSSR